MAHDSFKAMHKRVRKRLGGAYIKHNFFIILLFTLLVLGLTSGSHASVQYDKCEIISGSGHTSGVNEGYFTTFAFYNYCPLCGHHNCLERGIKRNDEISCWTCGADYSFSGKEKMYKPRAWLTPYYHEPVRAETAPTQVIEKTPLDLAKEKVQNYSHPFWG